MRALRLFPVLSLAAVLLGGQAAVAAGHVPASLPGGPAQPLVAGGLARISEVPVGALVFAGVGAFFLFRRGRHPRPPERD